MNNDLATSDLLFTQRLTILTESTLLKRLNTPGPKRILSLDGGGIKGIVTLNFLEKIESILRKRYKDKEYRLYQYFDLIGGTSTGSIIASGLALGMEVAEIKEEYFKLGNVIFGKKKGLFTFISKAQKYDSTPIETALHRQFGDVLLGDQESIKTGLCIVTKRADTFSTWPLINHPKGKFYSFNKDIPLWQAVRASVAAPTFFLPAYVNVGPDEEAAFIDGGVSMYNNPALQLFLMATLQGYPFRWQTGPDDLMLVSVGTGTLRPKSTVAQIRKANVISWASNIPEFFMHDASKLNQLLLQYLSDSPTARIIDSEIGNLRKDFLGNDYALHYLRYNILFDEEFMQDLGFDFDRKQLTKLAQMDNAKNVETLDEIASKSAQNQVTGRHFIGNFDPGTTKKHKKKRFVTGERVDLKFMEYNKKPVIVEAIRIDEPFEVISMEGLVKGKRGDYLMKGVEGELYVCDAEIFKMTYEKANQK